MAEVSVIIPTHDRAAVIGRAIHSVLVQKDVDFELVVVDDGSTDGTQEILREFQGHPQIRIITSKHQGVSGARNLGVSETSGRWIAFLDSDDEWLPGKLKAQTSFMTETDMEISQTREIWVRHGTRVNPPRHAEKAAGDLFAPSLARCMITPSSVILTRRLFEEVGGFRTDFPACEDYELWLRITSRYSIGLIDQNYLIRYGGHHDQLSARYPALDKFRLRAIADLLDTGRLAQGQLDLALDMLRKKLIIYRQGCLRRERQEELDWCLALESRFFGAGEDPTAY